jgi:hypothetical protein
MEMTKGGKQNTLAYYHRAKVTAVNSFIVQAPDLFFERVTFVQLIQIYIICHLL